ncbi:hypothetical protein [Chitinophaga filiformis]|uniref:Peptidase family M48 n=1 Tax=Chitinophaga filiformis TaxID=104663 RepID=A0ABY4I722_CHIFI|nr:hypothetical protein [Chitinophaga filiformis]UPK71385.1 hypothetical protein MYF79_08855 [Chitinophaga filiformis]
MKYRHDLLPTVIRHQLTYDSPQKINALFQMFTGANWWALLFLCGLLACHQQRFVAPGTDNKGSIDLSLTPFCGALPFGDSAIKRYELTLASPRAQDVMRQLVEYSGIDLNIAIYQGKVPNALATTIDGQRVIIYNEDFIDEIDKVSRTFFWQSIFILSHETGHLLYGHVLSADTAVRYRQELEADEFAGFILYRMGADINASTWIMNSVHLQNDIDLRTHPSRERRAAAIDRGWQKGYTQAFTIPVPPPPPFDMQERNNFMPEGYCDCRDLLSSDSIYRFHSDFTDGCGLDSMITVGEGMIDYFMSDSLVGPMVYRDTLIGVIIDLRNDEYEQDLGGMLESTDLKVRIFRYNRAVNPLFTNYNLYITDLQHPKPEEGAWNYFTKMVKPGQWIKFKVIVENATTMFNTYRFSYLEFIPPPKEVAGSIILSPFSKNTNK